MKDKNLNPDIKNTLQQYEVPVDTDQLWAAIADNIPKKESNKKPIWIFLLGASILIFAASLVYMADQEKLSSNQKEHIAVDNIISTDTKNQATKSTSNSKEEFYSSKENSHNNRKETEPKPSNGENKLKNHVARDVNNSRAEYNPNSKVHTNDNIEDKTSRETKKSIGTGLIKTTATDNIKTHHRQANHISGLTNISKAKNDEPQETLKALSITPLTRKATSILPAIETKANSARAKHKLSSLDILAIPTFTIEHGIVPIAIINKKKLPSRWHIGLSIFGGMSSRSIKSINTENQSYVDLLNSSEQSQHVIGSQLNLSFSPFSNLTVRSGLRIEQITDKIQFTGTQESSTIVIDTTTRIRSDGITERFPDRFEVTKKTTTDFVRYTRHRRISIPLICEYTFLNSSRWSAHINSGILFNISSRSEGSYLNSSENVIKLDSSFPTSPYLDRTNLAYQVGTGISYYISPRLSLGVSGEFIQIGNIHTNTAGIISNYQNLNAAFNLRLGL